MRSLTLTPYLTNVSVPSYPHHGIVEVVVEVPLANITATAPIGDTRFDVRALTVSFVGKRCVHVGVGPVCPACV